MSEYDANQALKQGAANVRNPRARTRASDTRAPVARFIFRALVLATWGAAVYTVAVMVLA